MSKREQAVRSSSANECPAGHLSEGIQYSLPEIKSPPCGVVFKIYVRFQALPGVRGGRMSEYSIGEWHRYN